MNEIEELIALHCANGVEFRELGDTDYFKVTMGQSPDGKSVTSDKSGLEFHQGKTNFTGFIVGSSNQYTSQPTKIANPNSILMSVRAPVGAINYTDRKICIGRGLCSIETTEKIESKFLYYIMQIYGQVLSDKSTGSTFDSTNATTVKAIKIPIPPISVQQEIVKILDRFIELETELELQLKAELEARKKQYDFYRNKLLSFSDLNTCGGGVNHSKSIDCVVWMALGEVAKISNGKDHKHLSDGKIPVYGSGGIMRYADSFIYEKESVLIPRKGSIGNIFYVNDPFWTVDTIFYTKIDLDLILPKFLFYFLQMENLEKLNFAGGVPSLTKTILDKIKIPIPPLAEQERIVMILDKFNALVNDISVGIPAEIKARRKQYEYYRGKLLDFKPLNN